MPRRTRKLECPRDPVALGLDSAASFLDISPEHFMDLVKKGLLPSPRALGARVLWDADEIIAAYRRAPRRTYGAAAGGQMGPGADSGDPYDRPPRA